MQCLPPWCTASAAAPKLRSARRDVASPPSATLGVIDVLEQYVEALGGQLEVSVVQGRRLTSLLGRQRSKT